MNILFGFYGILYGPGGRTGSDRDWRHCWPNIQKMLIDPFLEQDHDYQLYFSSYPFANKDLEGEFENCVLPDGVFYSKFEGSDPFTAKGTLIDGLCAADYEQKADLVVFTRSDVHWSRKLADENIDFTKFNFLFKEKDWWESHSFSCDNLYVFPAKMLPMVRQAMHETYAWPRGKPYVDTHGLYVKLSKYLRKDQMHFISDVHETSDVNSFYTCCRNGLPEDGRGGFIHPEVRERFNYSEDSSRNWR